MADGKVMSVVFSLAVLFVFFAFVLPSLLKAGGSITSTTTIETTVTVTETAGAISASVIEGGIAIGAVAVIVILLIAWFRR